MRDLAAEGAKRRECDRWDAVLMKYFAGREGEPPWYWIGPERQQRMAYWGLRVCEKTSNPVLRWGTGVEWPH